MKTLFLQSLHLPEYIFQYPALLSLSGLPRQYPALLPELQCCQETEEHLLKVKNIPLVLNPEGTEAPGYRYTGMECSEDSIPVILSPGSNLLPFAS